MVILLGIMAAIVVPQFATAGSSARASMLADDLRVMRMQIEICTQQHGGVAPGYPQGNPNSNADGETFVQQITSSTNFAYEFGERPSGDYPFGPYMSKMVVNPVNDRNTVRIHPANEALPTEASNTHGWIYCPVRRIFLADAIGVDERGLRFIEY